MSRFINLLPPILREVDDVKTVSSIIDDELNAINSSLKELEVLTNIDSLNDVQLDRLAGSFHLQKWEGYVFADTVEKKRKLIKNVIQFHKNKGSVQSIKQMLYDLGIDATMQEWFNYEGGLPYHFKIFLGLNEIVNIEKVAMLYRLIDELKPIRAKLDGVIFKMKAELIKMQVGMINYNTNIITINS